VRKSLEYALQIAHGLVVAREKGIIHRHLKPENLHPSFVRSIGGYRLAIGLRATNPCNWSLRFECAPAWGTPGYCSDVGAVRRLLPNVQLTPDDVP